MKCPFLLLPVLAASLIALAGCKSTPARVDTGPIPGRTFNFIQTNTKPSPGYVDQRQVIHPMVQGAIVRTLAQRGLSHVANGGDLTVAYLIVVGNNASAASINDYFGYRDDAQAIHDKAFDAYTGSKNPNYFEAGTLVIDILDSKSFKLLKRGYATRPLLRNIPDDVRAERIQGIVEEILRDVKVAH